uniref:Peptidyl-prolyl cis-trans isomerase n=1 Tax=Proboscia inermis TaxID=420281 RepID=A0A6T8NDZ4_9STRA|mmetsp:Transcript_4845/g.5890  ORF Transcript_4845/g.5890 Transcript_4845/m.5890 type:complete len:117 (-) Transcript_4845:414-764(-)|eukprot:CAMPEP_0171300170 /NCGR_PEP_ID=MMETSP0816-20121228/8969_1 /TAXON_ID=420281 /ORGANISM="Proboscia inermis, Strain CCAP1064/1" /LENGTH=116 /DNA_ID=CAMNT_0011776461 /DNA_START=36 /DNA_END=386 /DNA_ORIENTATION=+
MTTEVRAAHLLIKHTGSRNPVSRRTGDQVTISPQIALAELQSFQQKITQEGVHESFPKYANERSDCSSFRANGDLGNFGRGAMQKPFEDATFGLAVGEMSGIVSTDSGYHLIYRIE